MTELQNARLNRLVALWNSMVDNVEFGGYNTAEVGSVELQRVESEFLKFVITYAGVEITYHGDRRDFEIAFNSQEAMDQFLFTQWCDEVVIEFTEATGNMLE